MGRRAHVDNLAVVPLGRLSAESHFEIRPCVPRHAKPKRLIDRGVSKGQHSSTVFSFLRLPQGRSHDSNVGEK